MRGNAPTRGFTFVGLVIMMVIGCTVYLKLWSVSSYISLRDAEIMRSQFERAQNEALDESAEWRMKYDEEVQRSGKYLQELVRVREELEKKIEETEKSKSDLAVLQKEKQSLHKRTESLLHELQSVKMKCHI
ncbi:uncharacterized protein LOC116253512 isoform X1 [Nymphaea colorata]|nr:uncharacterized protein LOC116253512 isoform X1 [Nymphaea colorata]